MSTHTAAFVPTAAIFPEPTMEQELVAVAKGVTFASVETRMGWDGIALVIGSEPRDPDHKGFRCFQVKPDGSILTVAESIARTHAEQVRLVALLAALDVRYDDVAAQARAIIVESLQGQLGNGDLDEFENAEVWAVARGTRHFETKGGDAIEAGDLLMVQQTAADEYGTVTAYCPRRCGLVSVPAYGYFEVLTEQLVPEQGPYQQAERYGIAPMDNHARAEVRYGFATVEAAVEAARLLIPSVTVEQGGGTDVNMPTTHALQPFVHVLAYEGDPADAEHYSGWTCGWVGADGAYRDEDMEASTELWA